MKIMLVTDAWHPQVNGVVHTWSYITNIIGSDHDVTVLNPYVEGAEHLPLKLQGNIPILKNANQIVSRYYDEHLPDRVHIATEGSLGFAMRQFCRKNKINYNTSYHTRLADYGRVLYGVPTFLTWLYVRWFHKCSRKVLVTTKSIARQLGLSNCIVWGRGVDTRLFNPGDGRKTTGEKTIITVARVSKDKNLDDFCRVPGYRKIVVGDGPYLNTLKTKYPDVEFAGYIPHNRLKDIYTEAQVFVFPSKFDTFGLVILEAMACGLPVVGYNVPSPKDIIQDGVTGYLGDGLEENVERAFGNLDDLSRNAIEYARKQSWTSIADQFINHLM